MQSLKNIDNLRRCKNAMKQKKSRLLRFYRNSQSCREWTRTTDLMSVCRPKPTSDCALPIELHGIPFYIHQRDHATQPLNIRVRLSVSLFLAFFREVNRSFQSLPPRCSRLFRSLLRHIPSAKPPCLSFGIGHRLSSAIPIPALRWVIF